VISMLRLSGVRMQASFAKQMLMATSASLIDAPEPAISRQHAGMPTPGARRQI
jgi:hypothetical protein